MKRDYVLYIKDILDCVEKIEDFVGDMDFDEFVKDDKTTSAVVRKLEIIGEATKNIPEEMRVKYQEIPWSKPDMGLTLFLNRQNIAENFIHQLVPDFCCSTVMADNRHLDLFKIVHVPDLDVEMT